MKMFSIALSRTKEFSVIGVVNFMNQSVKFQGLVNGVPFIQSEDYNEVRDAVVGAVELNQPNKNREAC